MPPSTLSIGSTVSRLDHSITIRHIITSLIASLAILVEFNLKLSTTWDMITILQATFFDPAIESTNHSMASSSSNLNLLTMLDGQALNNLVILSHDCTCQNLHFTLYLILDPISKATSLFHFNRRSIRGEMRRSR